MERESDSGTLFNDSQLIHCVLNIISRDLLILNCNKENLIYCNIQAYDIF